MDGKADSNAADDDDADDNDAATTLPTTKPNRLPPHHSCTVNIIRKRSGRVSQPDAIRSTPPLEADVADYNDDNASLPLPTSAPTSLPPHPSNNILQPSERRSNMRNRRLCCAATLNPTQYARGRPDLPFARRRHQTAFQFADGRAPAPLTNSLR